ncbi:hypothetical protein C0389_03970 [bacterium]|nr:hypothetical protein [bacterium]
MTTREKNRYRSAGLLLAFYAFFVLFAALHTHRFLIPNGNSVSYDSAGDSNTIFDPFFDENSICRLIQFNNTNIIIGEGLAAVPPYPSKTKQHRTDYSNYYFTKHFYNFDLRAPPISHKPSF